MSQENVEIVRAAIDAWNRGDFDAWISAWDEQAEFHPLRSQLEGHAYHGHEGLRRFVAEMAEDWAEVRFEVDEIRGAGEQVVALGHLPAGGRASGVGRDVALALVGVVRDRKVVYSRCVAVSSRAARCASSGRDG